jgi:hypothetical protein
MLFILFAFIAQKVDSWNLAMTGFSEVLSHDAASLYSQGTGIVGT